MRKQLTIIMATGCAVLFVLGSHACADLVAHWTLDDNAANTTVADSAGSNTGTASNNTDTMHIASGYPPLLNGAFAFDGTTDGVNFGDIFGSFTQKTVLLWVKKSATSIHNTYLYHDNYLQPSGGDYIYIRQSDGEAANRFAIALKNSDGATAGYTFADTTDDIWLQIGYTWNGTTVRYYLNGAEIAGADDSLTGTLDNSGSDLTLGYYWDIPDNSRLTGALDDVRIYDEALSAAAIQQLYEDATEGLIAHWTMDDNAANTTVVDSAGGDGNTGTASNNTDTMHIESGPGHLGGAFEFGETSDVVNLGNALQGFTKKTVMMWVKRAAVDDSSKNRYLYFDDYIPSVSGDQITLRSGATDNRLFFAMSTDTGSATHAIPTNDTPNDIWFQVGYTWDGTTVRYYLNGAETGTADPLAGTMACSDGDLYLGTYRIVPLDREFDGALDDLRIYNRALSAAEVLALYDSAFPKGTTIVIR